jgi:putative ABC transport system permease protein
VTWPTDFTEEIRIALMEPGAVAADVTALPALGMVLGGKAALNGLTVTLRAIQHDFRDVD